MMKWRRHPCSRKSLRAQEVKGAPFSDFAPVVTPVLHQWISSNFWIVGQISYNEKYVDFLSEVWIVLIDYFILVVA